ncbi:MAG: acyl-CoA carboxylase epsilon subunit [Kibdelosporangium sp.]
MTAPVVRIVRGQPDDIEIAAATAAIVLLVGRGTESSAAELAIRSGWVPEYAYRPPGTWASS